MVAATVFSDLVFIFSSTIASSSVGHYDRILILSFFVLHSHGVVFRPHARHAGAARGRHRLPTSPTSRRSCSRAALAWGDELWSVALFTIAAVVFILQYGSFQRRLGRIIDLFEAAEEGDFSRSVRRRTRTRHPDAITSVGRAYNRVRVQLASMVLTDPLTGCLNRRGLDQALAREIARSRRAGQRALACSRSTSIISRTSTTPSATSPAISCSASSGCCLGQTARRRRHGRAHRWRRVHDSPAGHGSRRARTAPAVRMCEAVRNHAVHGERQRDQSHGQRRRRDLAAASAATRRGQSQAARGREALYAAKRSGR